MALDAIVPVKTPTPPAADPDAPASPTGAGSPYDDIIFGEMQDRFEANLATYLRNVKAGDAFSNASNLASTLGQATGAIG